MKKKSILAAALTGALAVSVVFTGCGSAKAGDIVATLGDKQITFGVANFLEKYNEAYYDMYYMAYFGDSMWTMEINDGVTMYDSVKGDVMNDIEQLYRLDAHAADYGVALTAEEETAIADAAAALTAANTKAGLKALGAEDESVVREYFRVYTVGKKVTDCIKAETEITVTKDDAASKTIRYISVNNAGHYVDSTYTEYTEEEKAELAATIKEMAAKIQATPADVDTIAEEYGYSVTKYSYAADESTLASEIISAVNTMQVGAVSDPIETDGYTYVVIYDSAYDEDATVSKLAELENEQRTAHVEEVLAAWAEEVPFEINESVWEKCKLNNYFSAATEE